MIYLTVASLVAAAIAVFYAIKQTNIAAAMKATQDEEQREVRNWQLKHEAIATQLACINLQLTVQLPGTHHQTTLYSTVFPTAELRSRIETYIIELADNRTRFVPRKPTPHELRSPTLRQTVERASELLDQFKAHNPGAYRYFRAE
jgi:hypothetical protein